MIPFLKTRMPALLWMPLFAAFLASGCAASQGLQVQPLQDEIQRKESRFFGGLPSPPTVERIPVMERPALGLYLKPTGFLRRLFDWTDRDREMVVAWANSTQPNPAARKHGLVPQSSLKDETLRELRESAARYGYDLLLIFDGAAAVDRYNNYKAPLFYWTIIGAYVADGTQSDALCLVNGSVWDVKTGVLLFSEQAEGRVEVVGPAAYVEDEAVILGARKQALTNLLEKIAQKLPAPKS